MAFWTRFRRSSRYLAVLNQGEQDQETWAERYWRPEPQLDSGVALRGVANAMIDISDGLCQDLLHLLDRGTETTAVNLQSKTLPLCEHLVTRFGLDKALEYALTGGDDYCLLASIPPGLQVPPSGKRIGLVIKRDRTDFYWMANHCLLSGNWVGSQFMNRLKFWIAVGLGSGLSLKPREQLEQSEFYLFCFFIWEGHSLFGFLVFLCSVD